jgi:hypothetical protein
MINVYLYFRPVSPGFQALAYRPKQQDAWPLLACISDWLNAQFFFRKRIDRASNSIQPILFQKKNLSDINRSYIMGINRSQQLERQFQREYAQDRAEGIIAQSPPILADKIAFIRTFFEDELRRSIIGRYQVAVVIQEIHNDVTDNKGTIYGTKAVKVIKDFFGWDDTFIYNALNVAETYTLEEIELIAGMRSPLGKPLSYSHVVTLATIEDEKKRQTLLNQSVKESWTYKKLANAVDLVKAPYLAKKETRGRPLARPRSFDAVLDQQDHFVRDFLSRNEEVWTHAQHSLSAKLGDFDTEDFTQERANRLQQHADKMALLAEKVKERADEAMEIHKLFVEVLKEQADGQKRLAALPGPVSEEMAMEA